jgi:trk system potassium uptake protein TrkH
MKKSVSALIINSFLITILIGAFMLMLPFSTARGTISPEDALFTATSAVTVTGLIVKDTPVDFTPFGQVVILILLQIGGLYDYFHLWHSFDGENFYSYGKDHY